VLTTEQIASIMLDLQAKGAANINFVTPTHVAGQILAALLIAVRGGLRIPLLWNSGGYDSPETLALIEGVVDLYMPDMKYSDADLARSLSGVRDYPQVNQRAVAEMHRQVGDLQINGQGRALRGVVTRHLVMPGHAENTHGVLDWIAANLGTNTYLSLMDQYRPAYRAFAREDIRRAITPDEYGEAREYALSLGLRRLDDSLTLPTGQAPSTSLP
jgi:putative pyruvate formate lyase activating enzyme